MYKRILMIVLVLTLVLALSACGCKHETWNDADCVNPKTCAECGETEGSPLGHTWTAASCEAPKTCETCGETEGEALGHSWVDATCEAPKTCGTCKLTEGEALGHDWQDATTETPKTCATCAATEGERIVTDPRFTTAATADLQGTWSMEVTMTGEMMGLEGFDGEFRCQIILDMGNDGTLEMRVAPSDDEEFSNAMELYIADMLYAELEAAGLNKEQADAAMVEAYGMDVEEYAAYSMSITDVSDVFESMTVSFVYYVEGDQFYMGVSWDMEMEPTTYKLEGDTLTMEGDISDIGAEQTVFTRVTG